MPSKPQNQRKRQPPRTALRAELRHSRIEPPTIFAYVDAVAQHGSIRKAADALHIAPKRVSHAVAAEPAE